MWDAQSNPFAGSSDRSRRSSRGQSPGTAPAFVKTPVRAQGFDLEGSRTDSGSNPFDESEEGNPFDSTAPPAVTVIPPVSPPSPSMPTVSPPPMPSNEHAASQASNPFDDNNNNDDDGREGNPFASMQDPPPSSQQQDGEEEEGNPFD